MSGILAKKYKPALTNAPNKQRAGDCRHSEPSFSPVYKEGKDLKPYLEPQFQTPVPSLAGVGDLRG